MEKTEKKDKIEIRKDRVQQLCKNLESEGYSQNDLTVSPETANTSAIITTLPFILIHIVLFGIIVGWESFINVNWFLLYIIFILSVIVHELIHGLFFSIFASSHFSAIEFGVLWKSLNPYCYCAEPINKTQYLIAILMPGIILGTCIGVISILCGFAELLVLSVLGYLGASGDFLIALKIIRFSVHGKKALFIDHPEKPGLLVFTKDV